MAATVETQPTPETAVTFRYYLETIAYVGYDPDGEDRSYYVFEGGNELRGRPAIGTYKGSKVVWVTLGGEEDKSVVVLPVKVEGDKVVLQKDNQIQPVFPRRQGRYREYQDRIPDVIDLSECVIPEPEPEKVHGKTHDLPPSFTKEDEERNEMLRPGV